MRRTISTLFFLFMMPLAVTAAQEPRLHGSDVYVGYSRTGSDTFYQGTGGQNGWDGALHVHLAPFLGGEAEIGQYGLGGGNVPGTTTVLFGPRVTAKALRFSVYAHGLVGFARTSNSSSNGSFGSVSDTGLGYALGGGVDIPLLPFFAWRIAGDRISSTHSPAEGTKARFSTGLVFRF
jgi:hypothetical protein